MKTQIKIFLSVIVLSLLFYRCTQKNNDVVPSHSISSVSALPVSNLNVSKAFSAIPSGGNPANVPGFTKWVDSVWHTWYDPILNPMHVMIPIKYKVSPNNNFPYYYMKSYPSTTTFSLATPSNSMVINAVSTFYNLQFSVNARYHYQMGPASINFGNQSMKVLSVTSSTYNSTPQIVGGIYSYKGTYQMIFQAAQYVSHWGYSVWWPCQITVTCGSPDYLPGLADPTPTTVDCEVYVIYPYNAAGA
ncbi:hypothetical protein [Mucilaginibacter sp. OK098]|uniref:hypothetical protein n=1 Tax=Mucilaginibacter sp. OK098 TaxID=1855297 RepID=UPI00091792C7|nr:hypothetical protein [Mucilaginibacter sp. OK098]SHM60227.1 hypothetical protein SAMN05216524_102661 [Mucilaginibacter sp. OK098]